MEEGLKSEKKPSLKEELKKKFFKSLFLKLILIGVVVLLCQIPVFMINNVLQSRKARCIDVEQDISSKWGGIQMVNTPVLSIPFSRQDKKRGDWIEESFNILPKDLSIEVSMDSEVRYRGIYEAVLYSSKWKIVGSFPDDFKLPADVKPHFDKARFVLGVSHLHGIANVSLEWNDKEFGFVSPSAIGSLALPVDSGIAAVVPVSLSSDGSKPLPQKFEIELSLNGCRELLVAPIADKNEVRISSDWNSPSFIGSALPKEREITDSGFQAKWNFDLSEFNRIYPKTWIGSAHVLPDYSGRRSMNDSLDAKGLKIAFGVSLYRPMSSYQQVSRVVDYDVLIFVIVLMAFLIAERATDVWMHPLQYFVAGLSLALFYSILLSFVEHVGFSLSYLIATVATAALCVFYSILIFRKLSAALGLGAIITLAYALVFVILRLQDYALLAGTAVMFVLLALLMAFTGKLNQTKDGDLEF